MSLKLMKKIVIVISCALILFSLSNCVYGSSASEFITSNLQGSVEGEGIGEAANMSKTIIGTILTVIRTVAAAIAVVIIIVIACKYIVASAGDRADIKKYAMNYIIGAVILFGASGILTLIQNTINSALGE